MIEKTLKPAIAGYLLVVTGIITILGIVIMTIILWAMSQGMAAGFVEPANIPAGLILVMGLMLSLPAIVSVIGGIYAVRRRLWGMALAGAICSCFYFNVLGIPALVLIILSKNEFIVNQT